MTELKALFGVLDINPAKLNNFSLTMEQIDSLAGDIAAIRKVSEYLTFKTGCTAQRQNPGGADTAQPSQAAHHC